MARSTVAPPPPAARARPASIGSGSTAARPPAGRSRRHPAPLAVLACAALLLLACQPPAVPRNSHGLPVVASVELYRAHVRRDPELALVDLATAVPGVALELRYATADNFLHRPLYPRARALLRRPAARALAAAQRELAAAGLGLKVWDAYRPYRVTVAMWEAIGDPDYVADPARGSRHNRGCAVDLTLVHHGSGVELAMPTTHDDFTPRAAHDFDALPAEVLANRTRLRQVMVRHGFVPLPSEWWHYDFAGWERFDLLDLPLDALP